MCLNNKHRLTLPWCKFRNFAIDRSRSMFLVLFILCMNLYNITLPHHLIKDRFFGVHVIERKFSREHAHYSDWIKKVRASLLTSTNTINYGLIKTSMKPLFILWFNIRFGTKIYRLTVRIPMGVNCAPRVADVSISYRDSVKSFSRENPTDITRGFQFLFLFHWLEQKCVIAPNLHNINKWQW